MTVFLLLLKKGFNYCLSLFSLFHFSITILVNRGWVPRNKIDPVTRSEAQVYYTRVPLHITE